VTARVTHVIQAFSRGGAGRALLSLAAGMDTIVSLGAIDPLMRARAEAAGATVLDGAGRVPALDATDVVLVHFWNTPELYEFLRGGLPPVRLAVWAHVAGNSPPQVVTREVVGLADVFAVTATATASLPVFAGPPPVIRPAPDPSRLAGAEPRSHTGFNVGYVGTLDFAKLHPRFAELCSAVDIADARFIVCGAGQAAATLAAQVDGRVELRGYVEEIGPALAEFDVFGYPLAPGNYATSDLALQEAMAAGIPPVVLAHGEAHRLVEHEVTGLVARDEGEYARLLEYRYANPGERLRLGENARARAGLRGPADVAREWATLFTELLERPKLPRPTRTLTGAHAFVESLGDTAPEFAASLAAVTEEEGLEAEARIAAAPPVLTSAAGGGILHYRRHYPNDGHLRLWAGLALETAGKHVLAVGELARARELGCDAPRVSRYLARAAAEVGATEVARAR
jgi:glycosyltransferase involved in cell wall biosynthesis